MESLVPIVSYEYTLVEGESVVTSEEWKLDGMCHRVDGPACREWQIVEGRPVLTYEAWWLDGKFHRVGGPAWRSWEIVEGRPVLVCEAWRLHGREVDPKDLHQAATTIRRWFMYHRDRREVIISSHLRKAGMIVFPGFMGLLRRF